MAHRLRLLTLAALAACARKRPPTPRRIPPARVAPAPAVAPAWTAAFDLRAGAADLPHAPDVVVHAPRGFDATRPLHLVIILHGMGHSALTWIGGGLPDPRTGRPGVGWGR